MNRNDWDKEFFKLVKEEEKEELDQAVTSAVIAGRLSIVVQAEKARQMGLSLKEFIECMGYIVNEEVKGGKVDGSTFEIPTGLVDTDDRMS